MGMVECPRGPRPTPRPLIGTLLALPQQALECGLKVRIAAAMEQGSTPVRRFLPVIAESKAGLNHFPAMLVNMAPCANLIGLTHPLLLPSASRKI